MAEEASVEEVPVKRALSPKTLKKAVAHKRTYRRYFVGGSEDIVIDVDKDGYVKVSVDLLHVLLDGMNFSEEVEPVVEEPIVEKAKK